MALDQNVKRYLETHGSGIYTIVLKPRYAFGVNGHVEHRPNHLNSLSERLTSARYSKPEQMVEETHFFIEGVRGEVKIPYSAVETLHKDQREYHKEKVRTEAVEVSETYL